MTELVLALLLGVLEWRMILMNRNVGTHWNGYGAISGTLNRNNPAPMRYRVLVPWLVWPLPPPWNLAVYQLLKVGLLWLALLAARPLLGPLGVFWLAVLAATTFRYDYWDCYAELLGVGLCLSGQPALVLLGVTVWALSRETVLLAAPLAFLAGGPGALLATGPGLLVWVLLHRYQGQAELYVGRWHLRAYNLPDLRKAGARKEFDPWLSLLWTVAVVVVALCAPLPGPLAATRWVPLAWLVGEWLLGRARETRGLLPTALWLAAALTAIW